jgi:hypothetical protein
MASEGFRPRPNIFAGVAICERASAPLAIALVTKSWGSLPTSPPAGNLPLTGTLTTGQLVLQARMHRDL